MKFRLLVEIFLLNLSRHGLIRIITFFIYNVAWKKYRVLNELSTNLVIDTFVFDDTGPNLGASRLPREWIKRNVFLLLIIVEGKYFLSVPKTSDPKIVSDERKKHVCNDEDLQIRERYSYQSYFYQS